MTGAPPLAGDYLRNPLPARPGVCAVCRGPAGEGFQRCRPCASHLRDASGQLADAVFPIAYAAKAHRGRRQDQHYEDLKRYKNPPVTALAQGRLREVATTFMRHHRPCVDHAARGRITHLAVVPSTHAAGEHPLSQLLGIGGRTLAFEVKPASKAHEFEPDKFRVSSALPHGARVLLLDDTWTTGANVQSAAYALRAAGAATVVAVVLGRLLDPAFSQAAAMLATVGNQPFDILRCASDRCAENER